jgi:hypothetical protein
VDTGLRRYDNKLAFAPFLFFDGLFFYLVELVEANQGFDVVPRGDAGILAQAGKFALLLQLRQRLLRVVEADQKIKSL